MLPEVGVVEVECGGLCATVQASPAGCRGKRVQVTLGSKENPQHHHPSPYGLSLFPCSWAQSEWSWIHPSVLKGKLSPLVQCESIPTGAVSLEKDHLKL